MSNISRRDFMKTAGVMTLAVAASGVLAGCSTASTTTPTTTTSSSLTVGDYTVTVDAVKLYDLQGVEKDAASTKSAKEAVRYIAFVISAVATKENTDAIDLSKVKVSAKNISASTKTSIGKKAFGYKATAASINAKTTALPTAIAYTTASGSKYCYIATVDDYGYEDAKTFKAPSITLYTQKGAEVTGSISVTVPSVETIYSDSEIL